MYLLLDLSEKDIIKLNIFDQNNAKDFKCAGRNSDLLKAISDFLSACGLAPQELRGVAVVIGEGSFSNTRISVVTANTLAYVQKIPVLGVSKKEAENPLALVSRLLARPVGEYVLPSYSGEANISKPKQA
jgi:tRNA A37 threonylcarbamoyladenosine modification protein TsaB